MSMVDVPKIQHSSERYVVKCGFKNGHQKNTCFNKIGLFALIAYVITSEQEKSIRITTSPGEELRFESRIYNISEEGG